ncbi:MAG: sigma-70 family RNA polymerase sigma factor [Deltaproteobacteria bacterium]|nr:sigma-70 family RNA polymerase sigma factor [Deltaproteobacteria bacterium]
MQRLVARIARRLPRDIDDRELVSAGTIGLLDAIRRYSRSPEQSFRAYAEIRIRGAILDELRTLDTLPRLRRRELNQLRRTRDALMKRLGTEPSDGQVADELGLSLETYHALVNLLMAAEHLALPPAGSTSAASAEESDGTPFSLLHERRVVVGLRSAIAALPARASSVLWLHDFEGHSLRQIGERLGVTESRVCQIRSQALRAIRARLAHVA